MNKYDRLNRKYQIVKIKYKSAKNLVRTLKVHNKELEKRLEMPVRAKKILDLISNSESVSVSDSEDELINTLILTRREKEKEKDNSGNLGHDYSTAESDSGNYIELNSEESMPNFNFNQISTKSNILILESDSGSHTDLVRQIIDSMKYAELLIISQIDCRFYSINYPNATHLFSYDDNLMTRYCELILRQNPRQHRIIVLDRCLVTLTKTFLDLFFNSKKLNISIVYISSIPILISAINFDYIFAQINNIKHYPVLRQSFLNLNLDLNINEFVIDNHTQTAKIYQIMPK